MRERSGTLLCRMNLQLHSYQQKAIHSIVVCERLGGSYRSTIIEAVEEEATATATVTSITTTTLTVPDIT